MVKLKNFFWILFGILAVIIAAIFSGTSMKSKVKIAKVKDTIRRRKNTIKDLDSKAQVIKDKIVNNKIGIDEAKKRLDAIRDQKSNIKKEVEGMNDEDVSNLIGSFISGNF